MSSDHSWCFLSRSQARPFNVEPDASVRMNDGGACSRGQPAHDRRIHSGSLAATATHRLRNICNQISGRSSTPTQPSITNGINRGSIPWSFAIQRIPVVSPAGTARHRSAIRSVDPLPLLVGQAKVTAVLECLARWQELRGELEGSPFYRRSRQALQGPVGSFANSRPGS